MALARIHILDENDVFVKYWTPSEYRKTLTYIVDVMLPDTKCNELVDALNLELYNEALRMVVASKLTNAPRAPHCYGVLQW